MVSNGKALFRNELKLYSLLGDDVKRVKLLFFLIFSIFFFLKKIISRISARGSVPTILVPLVNLIGRSFHE